MEILKTLFEKGSKNFPLNIFKGQRLTHFRPIFHFYTSTHQKTGCILIFSDETEMKPRPEMGQGFFCVVH